MWKDYIYLKQIAVMNYELCSSLDTSSSESSPDSSSEDSFFFLDFLDFLDDWLNDSESTSKLLFFLCLGGVVFDSASPWKQWMWYSVNLWKCDLNKLTDLYAKSKFLHETKNSPWAKGVQRANQLQELFQRRSK